MDVVITPPRRLEGIYADNRIWAGQFVGASPTTRTSVEITRASPAEVLNATRTAIRSAGSDGRVIFAVGHGGAASGPTQAGVADFGPQRCLRVTQFVAFLVPNTAWAGVPSAPRLQAELDEIEQLPNRRPDRARQRALTAWCMRYANPDPAECARFRQEVAEQSAVQPQYDQLCELFQRSPVSQIVLLTCNVGNATWFVDELSTDLGVPVLAYTRPVSSRRERRRPTPLVRMFLEGDPRGSGTNVDACMTQLIPNAAPDDYYVGSVVPQRAGRRRSRLPPRFEPQH